MNTEYKTNNYTNYAHFVMNEIKFENSSYDELKVVESYGHGIDSFTNFQLQRKPKIKAYHELTYENTKDMTPNDVRKYFPDVIEEEISHINFMIKISNNFSKNTLANKAIFEEAKFIFDINDRVEFSLGLALEKENFLLEVPALHDVLIKSKEWIAYEKSGGKNATADGIFMNEQHEARYYYGKRIKYNETLFTQEEATDFLITMINLAKENYESSIDSEFKDDYKIALDRYSRLYETYIEFLLI